MPEPYSEAIAESCVDLILHLLIDGPEVHAVDVETERWEIELGERVAFRLGQDHLGDWAWFIIMDAAPWLYAVDPLYRATVDGVIPLGR